MSTAKDEVRDLLDRLPDDVSLEDIQYHLHVRQKIERARLQVAAGETFNVEEFEQRMAKYLK